MKKMKLFLMLFIAAASVCNFVSCDKDDDDKGSSASIVGTWEYREAGWVDVYTFSANGSYSYSCQEGSYTGSDYGTYTYKGTTLTLNSSKYGGGAEEYTATISGNKLTIIEEGDPFVYTRK